ncbi:MAG: hypothetical protein L0H73_09365 [Nitrococcus sp.]|nr:hypothetical protein [Nitrococcus sp.]
MKQLLVDTGAWSERMDRNDPDHAAVQTCLGAATQPLVITDYILCEALTLTQSYPYALVATPLNAAFAARSSSSYGAILAEPCP